MMLSDKTPKAKKHLTFSCEAAILNGPVMENVPNLMMS